MKMLSKIGMSLAAVAFLGLTSVAQAKLENPQSQFQQPLEVNGAKLSLVFSGGVDLSTSAVEIRDERGRRIQIGRLELSNGGSDLQIPLNAALRPGVYTISWHATSTAGMVSEGSYSFVITPFGGQAPTYASQ